MLNLPLIGKRLLASGLLVVALESECQAGSGVSKAENVRLHVSLDQGLVTVSAVGAEFGRLTRAIAAQTGIEIIVVTPPSGPMPLTLAIERQPVERAIRTMLRSIPVSGPAAPSYSFAYRGDELKTVRIIFPTQHGDGSSARSEMIVGQPPEPARRESGEGWPENASEQTHTMALEPGKTWGRALTAGERRQLMEELTAAGIPTESLDDGQLSGIKRLKEVGLSLTEIRDALP